MEKEIFDWLERYRITTPTILPRSSPRRLFHFPTLRKLLSGLRQALGSATSQCHRGEILYIIYFKPRRSNVHFTIWVEWLWDIVQYTLHTYTYAYKTCTSQSLSSIYIEGMLRKSDRQVTLLRHCVQVCKSCLAYDLLLNFTNLQGWLVLAG